MMKTIALAANYAYINNIETTIKSIIYHNRVVKIYVFNYDIPQEWFIKINQYANQVGLQIIDQKFDPEVIKNVHASYDYIKPISYARFLIPRLLTEDKVLYLDSDLVVDHNLDDLFNANFGDNLFLAVKDYIFYSDHPNEEAGLFNTGVLLFNNRRLKESNKNLSQELLKLGENPALNNGDQTIFNHYFKGKIGELPAKYNYQIGFAYFANVTHDQGLLSKLKAITDPVIIHYVTAYKPFNLLSYGLLRDKYWFYRNLEWWQIVQKYTVFDRTKIGQPKFDGEIFIFTNQQEIQNLEKVIQKLPNIRFNVAAHTEVGWPLKELLKYPNYRVYPGVIDDNLDYLVNVADVYLDINYGEKDAAIIDRIKKRQLPILSFTETADHDSKYGNYQIFANDDLDGMVQKILEIVKQDKN